MENCITKFKVNIPHSLIEVATINRECLLSFLQVGSRGPCPLGELVVFEKYSGKSYRGECGCSPGYNQNYWPETGQCYEWYTQGPCKDSFLFQYNRELGKEKSNVHNGFYHLVVTSKN